VIKQNSTFKSTSKLSSRIATRKWASISKSLNLTDRQLDVVKGIFDGMDEVLIGIDLGISVHTVHSHRMSIYGKLEVRNSSDLISKIFITYLNSQKRKRSIDI